MGRLLELAQEKLLHHDEVKGIQEYYEEMRVLGDLLRSEVITHAFFTKEIERMKNEIDQRYYTI